MSTPAELLIPDARMRSVLAGELGFAPPAFVGAAGVVDGRLVLGSGGETVAISGGRAERIAEVPPLSAARVEWTDGLVPVGTGWSATAPFAVARVVGEGRTIATLTISAISASEARLAAVLEGVTGVPGFAILGRADAGEAQGTALGHAAVAALEALPPAGQELHLDRVVESGAPLAVWRPRPAESGETEFSVTPESLRLGPAVIRLDAGACVGFDLPSGAYAR